MEIIKIERLGHQGDGIAAGPVFVAGVLPGEEVSGDVVDGRIADPRIVTPSSDRVRPPCKHAKACGGCQLQFASDSFVEHWKSGIVRHALAAHGLETEMRPVKTSPAGTRRRASFSARRTKKGAQIGFHQKASDLIVEVPDCLLVDPALLAARPMIADLVLAGASRKGALSVSVTVSQSGLDVSVTGGKPMDRDLEMNLAQIAQTYSPARLSWGDDVTLMPNPPVQRFGAAGVVPPSGAFLQATPQGEAALLECVVEATQGADKIADLFSGCGTFALPLAKDAEVHAVEGDAAMVKALDTGWRGAKGLKKVTTEARDLFRRPLVPLELDKLDAVVIDPPRAGAEAQVGELCASTVPQIAYVSCNPVTFARDAANLVAAGYELNWVQVVDQFRWSTHVELAASFSKTG